MTTFLKRLRVEFQVPREVEGWRWGGGWRRGRERNRKIESEEREEGIVGKCRRLEGKEVRI